MSGEAPRLRLLPAAERFACCRLAPDAPLPAWARLEEPPTFVARTADELSLLLPESRVPADAVAERGFIAWRVAGPLDFALVGILARLATALAEAEVSLLAVSTFETDWLFVRAGDADRARRALAAIADLADAPAPR